MLTTFRDDMPSPEVFPTELKRWKCFCAGLEEKPETLQATIKICDKDLYPNIFKILKICCTWPVTTCECERSFSSIRRLNSYLRSTQTGDRLDNLAMISIHRDMNVDINSVIDAFAKLQSRRMELGDVLAGD